MAEPEARSRLMELFAGFTRRFHASDHNDRGPKKRVEQTSQFHNAINDILLMVFGYLDTVSLVCLQSTCIGFRRYIDECGLLDRNSFDKCTRWVIMCRYEIDALARHEAGKGPYPERLCCCLCKVKHPRRQFDGKSFHYLFHVPSKPKHFIDKALIDAPPEQRFCAAAGPHICYIGTTSPLPFSNPNSDPVDTSQRSWYRVSIPTCAHCRALIITEDDDDDDDDNYNDSKTSCGKCSCKSCPIIMYPHYLRVGPLWPKSRTLKVERFRYDREGNLRIVEKGASHSLPCLEVPFNI